MEIKSMSIDQLFRCTYLSKTHIYYISILNIETGGKHKRMKPEESRVVTIGLELNDR